MYLEGMKTVFTYSISVLILSSCMFIELNLTIKDNYESAMRNKELNVVFESPEICSLDYNDTIYAIKGWELKKCLTTIPKALVYIWPPYCKMDNCLAIHVVQEYWDTNGYDLFVVCTDYTVDAIKAQKPPKRPFF